MGCSNKSLEIKLNLQNGRRAAGGIAERIRCLHNQLNYKNVSYLHMSCRGTKDKGQNIRDVTRNVLHDEAERPACCKIGKKELKKRVRLGGSKKNA